MGMTASQAMGGSRKFKKDQKGEAISHQELIADSDEAERLYRAAINTASTSMVEAADGVSSADKRGAPISLVRRMNLSIREASLQGEEVTPIEKKATSDSAGWPSPSPEEAHQSMGLDVSNESLTTSGSSKSHHLPISKLPSNHSLRTLRFGGQSDQSPSSETKREYPLGKTSGAEDEEWNRGRTRSKRGLVWSESGPSTSESRPALNKMFSEEVGAGALTSEEAGEVGQGQKEEEKGSGQEIKTPASLSLNFTHTGTKKDVQERLKLISPIAEAWDGNQDD
ncbi:hypothetical protein CBS101457_000537 [Exobasidium rhododendri]|nr:hypothetical protein CBS101457_000537 [Exobasidium rhododendri]